MHAFVVHDLFNISTSYSAAASALDCSGLLHLSLFNYLSDSGIRHRNEDLCGTENQKSRKFCFPWKKNRQAYFYSMKIKMMDQ